MELTTTDSIKNEMFFYIIIPIISDVENYYDWIWQKSQIPSSYKKTRTLFNKKIESYKVYKFETKVVHKIFNDSELLEKNNLVDVYKKIQSLDIPEKYKFRLEKVNTKMRNRIHCISKRKIKETDKKNNNNRKYDLYKLILPEETIQLLQHKGYFDLYSIFLKFTKQTGITFDDSVEKLFIKTINDLNIVLER